MVRANGSYPLCPGFDSLHRHHPSLKQFRRDLKSLPFKDGDGVLVAVSGGGDSMGLLALLLSARPRPGLTLGMAHVHHNLRGEEADRDAEAVAAAAKAMGLPFFMRKLPGKPARGQSTEEWAREGRYGALEAMRVRGGWDWVATAHTLDDQAETVLMRIARGTGIQGLAGIHPVAGRVVRPVLTFSGHQLREAAAACGLLWLEDSTNRDLRYLRNRVRHEVLPSLESALPGISRRLAALARLAREAAPLQVPKIAALQAGTLYYDAEALEGLGEGQALEAFRGGIREARGHLRGITERHLRALWALRALAPGGIVALPGGWEGTRDKDGIRIGPASGSERRRHS